MSKTDVGIMNELGSLFCESSELFLKELNEKEIDIESLEKFLDDDFNLGSLFSSIRKVVINRYRKDSERIKISGNQHTGYVYLIKSNYGYKIGKTVSIKNRMKIFTVKLPFEYDVIWYGRFNDYSKVETELHKKFDYKRINGEWFSLDSDDILFIRSYEE